MLILFSLDKAESFKNTKKAPKILFFNNRCRTRLILDIV
jgi:hypothetical protein